MGGRTDIPLLEHGALRLGARARGVLVEARLPRRRYGRATRAFGIQPVGAHDAACAERMRRVGDAAEALEAALDAVRAGFDRAPPLFALRLLRSHLAGTPVERLADEVRAAMPPGTAEDDWEEAAFRQSFGPPRGRTPDERFREKLDALSGGAPSEAAHVLIGGPGRSGTRWLLEVVARLSAAVRPTLALVHLLPGDAWGDRKDRGEWDGLVASRNGYFGAGRAARVLDALRRLPAARTVPFVCPPGETLAAKASPRLSPAAWRRIFPRTRVVYAERDPRNVVVSRRWFFPGRTPWSLRWTVELGAVLATIAVNRARAARDGDVVVRYEDLAADLPRQLVRLSGFLGLRPDADALDAVAADVTFAAMAGRPLGELHDGEYFRGGSDWTREMTRVERLALALFDPPLRALGYPPTRGAKR